MLECFVVFSHYFQPWVSNGTRKFSTRHHHHHQIENVKFSLTCLIPLFFYRLLIFEIIIIIKGFSVDNTCISNANIANILVWVRFPSWDRIGIYSTFSFSSSVGPLDSKCFDCIYCGIRNPGQNFPIFIKYWDKIFFTISHPLYVTLVFVLIGMTMAVKGRSQETIGEQWEMCSWSVRFSDMCSQGVNFMLI